jgi:hypothetical protein
MPRLKRLSRFSLWLTRHRTADGWDPRLSTGAATAVVRAASVPIWAFVDFDPAGLVMANSLPIERFERLVLPSTQWLLGAADTVRGRQLFADQEQGCRSSLDQSTNASVRAAWETLQSLRSAVTQERMRSAPATASAHDAGESN